MPRTHYEILGVKKTASADEIRSAYRQLVLKHHPDRSKDPKSTEIFISVTQAYEVLSDPQRRKNYDALQSLEAMQAQQKAAESQQVRTAQYGGGVSPGHPPQKKTAQSSASAVTVDVTRLTMLFSRGQLNEAERLAQKILTADNRQPIPYAVLGDIARSRGRLADAAKMYAIAVQIEPNNALFQKRYAEVMRHEVQQPLMQENSTQVFAPLVGAASVLLGCFYLA